MKLNRKANIVGALMIAGGAIASGASITSGAMAADDSGDAPTANAVVIGSASADGDAYQCEFDDLELPTIDVSTMPAGVLPDGIDAQVGVIVSGEDADAAGTQIVTNIDGAMPLPPGAGAIEVTIGDDGEIVATDPDGNPIDTGDVQIGVAVGGSGTVSIDDSGAVILSASGELPDGAAPVPAEALPAEASPVEVREGTPEECAALLEQTTAMPGVPTVPGVAEVPGLPTVPGVAEAPAAPQTTAAP